MNDVLCRHCGKLIYLGDEGQWRHRTGSRYCIRISAAEPAPEAQEKESER